MLKGLERFGDKIVKSLENPISQKNHINLEGLQTKQRIPNGEEIYANMLLKISRRTRILANKQALWSWLMIFTFNSVYQTIGKKKHLIQRLGHLQGQACQRARPGPRLSYPNLNICKAKPGWAKSLEELALPRPLPSKGQGRASGLKTRIPNSNCFPSIDCSYNCS